MGVIRRWFGGRWAAGPTAQTEAPLARTIQEDATRAFGNPGDAAIFGALIHNPGLQGVQVTGVGHM